MALLYWARAASGTLLETHASYLAMKSSHSGTPIFSPAAVVAGVDAAVVLLELPAIVLLLFMLSVLLHPIRIAVHRTARINKVLRNIGVLLQSSARNA